jgi:2-polyprenyl-3-methyl-5-hydroxy-6-metoxy-1,4-benzoquinol methylase
MNAQMKWNEKFSCKEYLYGEMPNSFLKSYIDYIPSQNRVLFLGEGEGRNAVYAARKDLHVDAVDASTVGLEKAKRLSEKFGVKINAIHADLEQWSADCDYDYIMCSFLHLNDSIRAKVLLKAFEALKPFGTFIAEFFSTNQLSYKSGGPSELNLLYTVDSIKEIFSSAECDIYQLEEVLDYLDEGIGHQGEASLIRVVIKKR